MVRPRLRFLVSVKQKLFAGFFAMTLLMAGLGAYALISIDNAGQVVTDTFDRPLMAINFSRSASQTFKALELESLRRDYADTSSDTINQLRQRFRADLAIARERSIAPRANSFFDQVEQDFEIWNDHNQTQTEANSGSDDSDLRARTIEENLDIIVELQTNESFRNRESAINTMEQLRNFTAYALFSALFLTLGVSLWLALTIVRPLKAAARAAAQISGGRFDAMIPKGGDDETGQLLRTMSTMQKTIRNRMEAEQDLRTLAQHRLADSLENSKDAVMLTDADGCVIFANPVVTGLFGTLFSDPLVGDSYESYFGADGIPVTLEHVKGQDDNAFQLSDQRWVRVNASATREGGMLFIWSDITEARDRAERLEVALVDAQAASRAKALFLSAMGHELNTPLNAIVGLSDVLQQAYSSKDGDPSHARMAGLISQSGSHIADMVRDMLEIANDDMGPADTLALPLTDLRVAIDKALPSYRGLAETQSLKLIWTPPDHDCLVAGELEDLAQIICKLVDNSLKFNRPGGALKVQITSNHETGHSLHVVDSGIGIDPDQFDRILEPFIQIDQGYKRAVDGSGLGLTIVDRVVKRLGAHLSIRSVIGKGSVFTVTFPPANRARQTPQLNQERAA